MWGEHATPEQKRRHALALVALSTDAVLLAAAERVRAGGEAEALVEAIAARATFRRVTLDTTDITHLVRALVGDLPPSSVQALPDLLSPAAPSPLLPSLERVADRFSIVHSTLHEQVASAEARPNNAEHLPPSNPRAASDADLLIDPELARLAMALGHGRAFAVFSLAQQMTRVRGGGVVGETELITRASAMLGITPDTIRYRYLPVGDGVFWHARSQGHVGVISAAKVARRLVQEAAEHEHDYLYETNLPGVALTFIRQKANTLKGFYAACYAAWLHSRDGRTRAISRYTLTHLWGQTANTIRSWEKLTDITACASYAVYEDLPAAPMHHAYPAVVIATAPSGKTERCIAAMARASNTYVVDSLAVKAHHKVPKAVRRAARLAANAAPPQKHPGDLSGAVQDNVPARVISLKMGRRTFVPCGHEAAYRALQKHLKQDLRRVDADGLDEGELAAPHYVQRHAPTMARAGLLVQHSRVCAATLDQGVLHFRKRATRREEAAVLDGCRGQIVAAWREMVGM